MAVPSVSVLGLLGLAGLSLLVSLVIVATTPVAADTGETEMHSPPRAPAARAYDLPVLDAPEHMPAHGSWEALFQAWGV